MGGHVVVAVLLILTGTVFFLDTAGVLDLGDFWQNYWPLALVVVGVGIIIGHPRRPLGGLVVLVLGLLFLASEAGLITENWWNYAWPAAIALVGVAILVAAGRRPRPAPPTSPAAEPRGPVGDADTLRARAYFSGVTEVVRSQRFQGGSAEAFCGGVRIDLRQAQLAAEGARLDLGATLGGIEVFVPGAWRVNVHARPVLGGVQNLTAAPAPGAEAGPLLEIRASAIMGGVTIKN